MPLTHEQLHRLIELLKPNFESPNERQRILGDIEANQEMLSGTAPVIAVSLEGTSDEFTSALIYGLANDANGRNGHPAPLLAFLEMVQDKEITGALMVPPSILESFIEALRNPEPEPASTLSDLTEDSYTSPLLSNAKAIGASMGTVASAEKSLRRYKRRRSPVRRAFNTLRRVIPWRLVAAILLLAIILPTAGIVVFATDALAQVNESVTGLQRVMDSLRNRSFSDLTQSDIDRLDAGVYILTDSLRRARQQTSLLQRISFFSPDVGTQVRALDAAEQTALGGQDMLNGLKPVLYFLVNGDSQNSVNVQITSGERIIELLQLGQGQFNSAKNHLDTAKKTLDSMNLQNISPKLLIQLEQLIQYQDALSKIDTIMLESPDLLANAFGLDQARDYLVLSENSDELRPSGGYISTFGWMHVRRFRIGDYGYSPTTDVSPNPPPAELASQLPIPSWWLHFPRPIYSAFDESWYADFPSTAEMAAWYYEKGNNPRSPVQGVIAIDIAGFQSVLQGLGGVTVPNYNEVVTADNFRDVIYRIRSEDQYDLAHKTFLAALYTQILQGWQTIAQGNSNKIVSATLQALQQKHIMIYFRDPKLAEVMNMLGWSGAQTPGNYDYLMVADANLGNKSNSSITRDITYDVAIQPDKTLQSRATIAYDYSDAVASKDPAVRPEQYGNQKDYANLMQVFVPKGSAVTKTDNLLTDLQTDTWQNLSILISTVVVKYDTSERYEFSYTTPALVEQFGSYHRYRLLLQKQPGTPGDNVHIQVTLPVGSRVINTIPVPATNFTLDSPVLEFQTSLITDQWIEIIYQ